MDDFYVLEGRTPRRATVNEWGEAFESPARFLWQTDIGAAQVRTVFFGYDHNRAVGEVDGPPLLFGTMVFGDSPLAGQEKLYGSYEQAELGHVEMVAAVNRTRSY